MNNLPIDTFHSYDPVSLLRYVLSLIRSFFYDFGFLDWIHSLADSIRINYPAFTASAFSTSIFLTGVFCFGVVFYGWKIWLLHKEDELLEYATPPMTVMKEKKGTATDKIQERWQKVLLHVESEESSNWRLAIMEADIILDDMLDKQGYHGDSIGDKLKSVEPSDFNTVEQAWEAHKVRNQIAHEGTDFLLTHREAKRVIGLYKNVFEEFRMF
jgi:hypothetical protein